YTTKKMNATSRSCIKPSSMAGRPSCPRGSDVDIHRSAPWCGAGDAREMPVGWQSVRVRYASIPADELAPTRQVELRVVVVQMVLDCALGDSEMVGDLFVAGPLSHHSGDADLCQRQRGRGRPQRRLFSEQAFDGA